MDTVIWSCFNLQLTNKVHILLDNQSCAHQLSLLRNIQQRELKDRTRQQWVQTNQQWKMTMHHFPRIIITHQLSHNMILKFKGICLKSDANSNNWCAYAGLYLKQHVYTNVCWTHPFPQPKSTSRSQPFDEKQWPEQSRSINTWYSNINYAFWFSVDYNTDNTNNS